MSGTLSYTVIGTLMSSAGDDRRHYAPVLDWIEAGSGREAAEAVRARRGRAGDWMLVAVFSGKHRVYARAVGAAPAAAPARMAPGGRVYPYIVVGIWPSLAESIILSVEASGGEAAIEVGETNLRAADLGASSDEAIVLCAFAGRVEASITVENLRPGWSSELVRREFRAMQRTR